MLKTIKKLVIKIYMYLHYLVSTLRNKGKVVYMFNTPWHGNIGDLAIAEAEMEYIQSLQIKGLRYIQIPHLFVEFYLDNFKFLEEKNSLICVHGGGNFGTIWPNEQLITEMILLKFNTRPMIIFPQTAHIDLDQKSKFENNLRKIVGKNNKVTFLSRDEETYDYINQLDIFNSVSLVPDIVFSLKSDNLSSVVNDEVLFALRSDKEVTFTTEDLDEITTFLRKESITYRITDTVIPKSILFNRRGEVNGKLTEFSKSKLIVTDRLHGMIFAFLSGRPCIAFDNLSKKSSKVFYKWLSNYDYIKFCESASDFSTLFKEFDFSKIETDIIEKKRAQQTDLYNKFHDNTNYIINYFK